MKKYGILILIQVYCTAFLSAQSLGLLMNEKQHKVEIPFTLINDFIVIDAIFQGVLPLKFIFDTGAEHTILIKKEVSDLLGVDYHREFRIMGADLDAELIAYLARSVAIKLPNIASPQQDILVLKDDYFKMDEFVGTQIHGIIGSDMFKNYVVHINFDKSVIYLYRPEHFNVKNFSKYTPFPLDINRNKPYLMTKVKLANKDSIDAKLLLDTGASLALLLYSNTHPNLEMPKNYIVGKLGAGLGGALSGFMARTESLTLGKFHFDNLVTNFQQLNMDENSDNAKINNSKNGIIGTILLKKFEVIINYPQEKLYLKQSRAFKTKIRYDRSGMYITAAGVKLNTFTVLDVLAFSPADLADIRKGDEILKINAMPSRMYSLHSLTAKFQSKKNKKIKLRLKRGNEILEKTITLKDLI